MTGKLAAQDGDPLLIRQQPFAAEVGTARGDGEVFTGSGERLFCGGGDVGTELVDAFLEARRGAAEKFGNLVSASQNPYAGALLL